MDFAEDEQDRMLRDAVFAIASSYGHPYYLAKARAGEKTTELWSALAEHGFLGVNIPAEYGGGGQGMSQLAAVCEECAAAGCPLLMMLVCSPAICGAIIGRFGTVEQRERWLPGSRYRPGEHGVRDHRARRLFEQPICISTVATPVADGYRMRGTKYYISGVDEAPRMLVVARTGTDERTGRAQLSLFVVDTDAAGLSREVIPVEIVAPEKQFTLYFDDVELSPDRLVGSEGGGLVPLFAGLNPERILSAALLNGIGRYALGKAAAYARDRSVWGAPIGSHQGIAHPLAKAAIDVELARLMTDKAGWLYDAGRDAGEASNMAKLAAADAAGSALDQAIQTHGGNGMATEFGLATLWGMVRLLRIAPVSREMILNFVAQHTLGLPRSY